MVVLFILQSVAVGKVLETVAGLLKSTPFDILKFSLRVKPRGQDSGQHSGHI